MFPAPALNPALPTDPAPSIDPALSIDPAPSIDPALPTDPAPPTAPLAPPDLHDPFAVSPAHADTGSRPADSRILTVTGLVLTIVAAIVVVLALAWAPGLGLLAASIGVAALVSALVGTRSAAPDAVRDVRMGVIVVILAGAVLVTGGLRTADAVALRLDLVPEIDLSAI